MTNTPDDPSPPARAFAHIAYSELLAPDRLFEHMLNVCDTTSPATAARALVTLAPLATQAACLMDHSHAKNTEQTSSPNSSGCAPA